MPSEHVQAAPRPEPSTVDEGQGLLNLPPTPSQAGASQTFPSQPKVIVFVHTGGQGGSSRSHP